jgi:hypothetical protein
VTDVKEVVMKEVVIEDQVATEEMIVVVVETEALAVVEIIEVVEPAEEGVNRI